MVDIFVDFVLLSCTVILYHLAYVEDINQTFYFHLASDLIRFKHDDEKLLSIYHENLS